jgi:hypothetical protein
MRWFTLLFLALLGCRASGPEVSIDLRRLDGAPVVPIQSKTGSFTGTLRPDGTLLTCSHGIPRHERDGDLCVAGAWVRYHVVASGDDLAVEWHVQSEPPRRAPEDWAVITTEPRIDPAFVFHPPLALELSTLPPRVGETVYLVGYTVESTREGRSGSGQNLKRYWVPALAIEEIHDASEAEAHGVWIEASSEQVEFAAGELSERSTAGRPLAGMRRGFSGSPVMRVNAQQQLEVCAILVDGRYTEDGQPSRDAIAIPLPTAALRLLEERQSAAR